MKKLISTLLLILPLLSYCQKIQLSGKVCEPNNEKKLYFTFNDKPFNSQNYIQYSSDNYYKWELTLDKIKADSITELFFSNDTTSNQKDKYACVHGIKLDRILSIEGFSEQNNIKINCDVFSYFNCEMTDYYGAKEEGLGRFLGNYVMMIDNKTYNITLKDFAFRYLSISANNGIDELPEEYGSWRYDANNQILSFNVWIKRNQDLGLMKKTKIKYEFKVLENGNLTFESDKFKLKKVN